MIEFAKSHQKINKSGACTKKRGKGPRRNRARDTCSSSKNRAGSPQGFCFNSSPQPGCSPLEVRDKGRAARRDPSTLRREQRALRSRLGPRTRRCRLRRAPLSGEWPPCLAEHASCPAPRPPPELGRDRKAGRLRSVCSAPAFPLRRAPQEAAARLGAGLGPSAENRTGRDSG